MSQLLLMYALIFKCFCLNTDPFLTALLKWQMPSQLLRSALGSGTTPDLPTGGQCWSMQHRAWLMQSSLFAWVPECQCSTHTEYSYSGYLCYQCSIICACQRWLEALLFLVCESTPVLLSGFTTVQQALELLFEYLHNTTIKYKLGNQSFCILLGLWHDRPFTCWLFWLTNAHND